MSSETQPAFGEHLHVQERMVVAPADGTFEPELESGAIAKNQLIGYVYGPGFRQEILSPFDGEIIGLRAHHGERLRTGEPVAWLRTII